SCPTIAAASRSPATASALRSWAESSPCEVQLAAKPATGAASASAAINTFQQRRIACHSLSAPKAICERPWATASLVQCSGNQPPLPCSHRPWGADSHAHIHPAPPRDPPEFSAELCARYQDSLRSRFVCLGYAC